MDADQFQKSVGTRIPLRSMDNNQELTEFIGLILSDIAALGDAASSRFHYLWKGWNETDNIQVSEDICMLLGCVAEYATAKGYSLSDMMKKAIHLRNRRNNDMGGVN